MPLPVTDSKNVRYKILMWLSQPIGGSIGIYLLDVLRQESDLTRSESTAKLRMATFVVRDQKNPFGGSVSMNHSREMRRGLRSSSTTEYIRTEIPYATNGTGIPVFVSAEE